MNNCNTQSVHVSVFILYKSHRFYDTILLDNVQRAIVLGLCS